MGNKIIVCIPCYNCANQIPRVISGFDKALLARIEKVILIDNRSTDSTIESARRGIVSSGEPSKFSIIQNDQNYGLGGTHKVVFTVAKELNADYVGILHGDNQAKTDELNLLIDAANSHPECSAILGARFMKGSRRSGYSKLRTAGNMGLNILYSILCMRNINDLGSGINLFRVSDINNMPLHKFSDSFTFNMDLLLWFVKSRLPVLYIPITWSETDQISNAKTFKVGFITLKTVLMWRFWFNQSRNSVAKTKEYSFKPV